MSKTEVENEAHWMFSHYKPGWRKAANELLAEGNDRKEVAEHVAWCIFWYGVELGQSMKKAK